MPIDLGSKKQSKCENALKCSMFMSLYDSTDSISKQKKQHHIDFRLKRHSTVTKSGIRMALWVIDDVMLGAHSMIGTQIC